MINRPGFWLMLIAVAMLGIAPVVIVSAAEEDGLSWDAPQRLTSPEGRAWFPEIDAGVDGTVRLIWEEANIRTDLHLPDAGSAGIMLSTRAGEQWLPARDIYVKDAYNAGRPIIASDDTYMYLLSRSLRGPGDGVDTMMRLGGVYFTRAAIADGVDDARAWATPVQLSRSSAYWASIEVLGDGNLIVLYNEVVEYPLASGFSSQAVLMSRRSADYGATWDQPVRLSSPGSPAVRSSIAATGPDASVVICWDEGYDNLTGVRGRRALHTAVSVDGGKTWEDSARVEHLDPSTGLPSHPARGRSEQCVVESDGETTLLVYRSTIRDILLYRTSQDGGRTWSVERAIPDAVARPFLSEHHFDKLGLTIDAEGRFILAYVGTGGTTASGLSVMVATFKDDSWTRPVVVAAHDGYPEYPRITVASGNQVSIVYFVRDELYGDESPVTIWAVSGLSSAPERAPAAIQTAAASRDGDTGPADRDESSQPAPIVIEQLEPVPQAPPPVQIDAGSVVAPRPATSQPVYQATVATVAVLLLGLAVFVTVKGVLRARI